MLDSKTWLALFLLAATGCGDEAPETATSFRRQVRALFCSELAPCCRESGFGFDDDFVCGEALEGGAEEPEEDLRGVVYDEAAAVRCLDGLEETLSACSDVPERINEACDAAVTGTLEAGESCESSSQCAVPEDGAVSCFGFCQQFVLVGEGELCDNTDLVSGICRQDFYCADNRCQPRIPAGEPCDPPRDVNCARGSVCDIVSLDEVDAGSPPFVCAPRGVGTPCEDRSDCGDDGLLCLSATKTCSEPGAAGAMCANDGDCESLACVQGTCRAPTIATRGLCGDSSS